MPQIPQGFEQELPDKEPSRHRQAPPQSAPDSVVRFQKRENRTTGPKVTPKPAQAKDTISKIELLGFDAMTAPTIRNDDNSPARDPHRGLVTGLHVDDAFEKSFGRCPTTQPAAANPLLTW